jgi:hypothetical protein
MSDQKPAMGPTEMAEWLGTEEVPGYPGFVWHSKIGQTTPDLEKGYREGFQQAILSLSVAIKRGGSYERGYQHGLAEIARAMNRRGRLDAQDIEEWLSDTGRRWINDLPLQMQVKPPPIRLKMER